MSLKYVDFKVRVFDVMNCVKISQYFFVKFTIQSLVSTQRMKIHNYI